MALTITRLNAFKPKANPYKVTDGYGLYIEVTPSGGKLWRFRYRIGDRQKKICLGSFPEISLKEARDLAFGARQKVASGEELGLPVTHLDHHASYIASWLKILKQDERAILTAAAKAEEAATLLLDLGGHQSNESEANVDVAPEISNAA